MIEFVKKLIEQPYWIAALFLGCILILAPIASLDKDNHFSSHPPSTYIPIIMGVILLMASFVAFGFMQWKDVKVGGVDLTKVKYDRGDLLTVVNGCEIRVVTGSIVDYAQDSGLAVVLPCNEYFDEECVQDAKSALGAYINHVFEDQADTFITLARRECDKWFGAGQEQQKTYETRAASFGAGRCILLVRPLGKPNAIALVSTTTQRAGEGLVSRVSYLFDGIRELTSRLADERLDRVIMPVLGAGHGGLDPSIALVGLLLAVAEAARYGRGGQRFKKVTIVVFKRDSGPPQVNPDLVRRALALVGS